MATTAAIRDRSEPPGREDVLFADAAELADELVARACAIANDTAARRTGAHVARGLLLRLDDCERRARRLVSGTRALAGAAALEFVADAIAAATIDGLLPARAAHGVVGRVARHIGAAESEAALVVFRRAASTRECAQLPPAVAVDFILSLLADLAGTGGVSLWSAEEAARTTCLAYAGRTARSRRMRETARYALDGVPSDSLTFRTALVERWDRPYAALVARTRSSTGRAVDALLAEAAAALGPILERDALYDRGAGRERELVAAGERRLVRLGCDLHDGPLQAVVAFANDLRLTRSHIEPLLDEEHRTRAAGCFDDLAARLESLDRELRQIAHSVRARTALDRPLEDALRQELGVLDRAGIDGALLVTGDVDTLTDSQKVVIYRVVQEALANVRKHSGASRVSVRVRSTSRLIEVMVCDDGCGIRGRSAASDRLGLAGVTERVRLLGGAVTIGDSASGGTCVSAILPRWRARAGAQPADLSYAVTT